MKLTSTVTALITGWLVPTVSAQTGGGYDLTWSTIDSGGQMFSTGNGYELGGTIGQADAGTLTGGSYALTGGFWGAAVSSGSGVPVATLTSAVSRKTNPSGPGGVCDVILVPGIKSDPRQGGISQLRLTFNVAPGGPGANPVTIQGATCAAPTYAPYSGASTVSASITGNTLVLAFTPGLENAWKYKMTIGPNVTSIAGQFVEVRGLTGDATSDGLVNAADRSAIVGIWTGGGFSCTTDINGSGQTNAGDRSAVVGAWTGSQNCAP